MQPLARLLLLALPLLLLGLSGCTAEPDPELARLCRLALVATVDDPSAIAILRQSPLPGTENPGVRLDLGHLIGDPFNRPRFAECRFNTDEGRPRLTAFRNDHGTLSGASLLFMQRFWLDAPDSADSDPSPIDKSESALALPLPVAYLIQHLLNALPAMATYAMLSVAYALIYGLVGRINLAFGEMAAVGGAAGLTASGFVHHSGGTVLLILVFAGAVWGSVLHGVAIARVVFRPLAGATLQQGLVATVGLALALNEYLRLAQGQNPHWILPVRDLPIPIARNGSFVATVTPLSIEIAVAFGLIAAAVLFLMDRTQFGRNWRALADDPRAAALMGVDATGIFLRSFALASGLAGLAGGTVVLLYGNFGTTLGTAIGLKGLLAAVLGGIGSVRGALLGGICIALAEAIWSAYFPIEYRDLFLFSALAICLVLRPGGFFGDPEIKPRLV